MYLSVDLVSCAVLTIVACGGNYHDAGIDEAANGLAQRIIRVRIDRRCSKAEIHDANVVRRAVCHSPVQRTEQRRRRSYPVTVEHTQVNELGVRSYTAVKVVETKGEPRD